MSIAQNKYDSTAVLSLRNAAGLLEVDRVELCLREEVAQGQCRPGSRLDHEIGLAEKFGVSRQTIRRAMGRLKKDKLVHAIRGKGTFISNNRKTGVYLISSNQYHPYNTMAIGVLGALLKKKSRTVNLMITTDPVGHWPEIADEAADSMGVVLLGEFPAATMDWLADNAKVPFVLIGEVNRATRRPATYNQVVPDHAALGYRAAEHLLGQGHQRIGFLTWENPSPYNNEYESGIRQAMSDHGVNFNPDWSVYLPNASLDDKATQIPSNLIIEAARVKIDRWFDGGVPPTALIHLTSAEMQIQDILHHCCRDHFAPEAILVLIYHELLRNAYVGLGEAMAVCTKFETMARKALELLEKPKENLTDKIPARLTLDNGFLCRRQGGIWEGSM